MKNSIKIALLFSALIVMVVPAFAQGAPPATPIDGGLSILLAAGALFGVKKIRDSKK